MVFWFCLNGRVLIHHVVKDGAQLRVDGALAAVHHDHGVELPARRIEDDLIVADERIAADAVGPEVRRHVVPIGARAADGH